MPQMKLTKTNMGGRPLYRPPSGMGFGDDGNGGSPAADVGGATVVSAADVDDVAGAVADFFPPSAANAMTAVTTARATTPSNRGETPARAGLPSWRTGLSIMLNQA